MDPFQHRLAYESIQNHEGGNCPTAINFTFNEITQNKRFIAIYICSYIVTNLYGKAGISKHSVEFLEAK